MARFDVHPRPGGGLGYVVNVQAELLSALTTRVVVPLLPEDAAPRPIGELNPRFEIAGRSCVLLSQALAAVPVRSLARPVASLAAERDAITRAPDLLLVGF